MTSTHVALYRKYRPQKFEDVVEQHHIVDVLKNTIKLGNISHAYLFEGSRGTGKTTMARIFAGAIGCTPNDLYEIDAASNRGIDDIRELRESVATLPFESPYKVYIIDEVHMLTKEAFNALLKTLEEPPKHAVFVLATTETDKIPETVVSRCQTFSFKKPSQAILKDVVLATAKKEGYTIDTAGAELIATLGDGSFRDTLGTLEKVIGSSKDKKLAIEEIELVLGAPRRDIVNDFISALATGDKEKGLNAIRKAAKANIDMKVYLRLILQKTRFVLLLKNSRDMAKEIKDDLSAEDFDFLSSLAADPQSKISSVVLLELLHTHGFVGKSYIPELPLELALLKLTNTA